MAGTKLGGQKAAQTNKERHGEDFYSNIGKKVEKTDTPAASHQKLSDGMG